ncbi:ATP-dependent Clp protease proteolytic subunit [Vibrio coralliirubri]|uniref:ClpP family protease n=1 Tax=Vibrio coralliirubri TaxID=1516159 RepID=UPI0022837444|nr:ATP-dependent Clp protease proteolytic subunit [Vibrio coralliirubri]MCY9860953.1 ATP-dependent Clp protease proteolytic subunit [Vibrio coralliirubri]
MSEHYFVPRVEYVEQGVHKSADPYSFLLSQRVVYLPSSVNPVSANAIIAQFLALEKQDPNKDIDFYINSGGGHVTEGLAMYDAMLSIKPKVNTVCVGQACSMGAFLLAGGTGARVVTPNARVMIHQVSGGSGGQTSDILIQAAETQRLNDLLMDIMSKNSDRSFEEMKSACDRDKFLTPEMAVEFGLADRVLVPHHTTGKRK